MTSFHQRSSRYGFNIWPGWVDALSSLLMVVIFVLMVFMVAQFYLSNLLTGREELVERLNRQIGELSELLDLERGDNADLRARFAVLSADLQEAVAARDALRQREGALIADRDALAGRLAEAERTVEADRETITVRLREIASLEADLAALRAARSDLETQVAALGLALRAAQAEAERLGSNLEETAREAAAAAEARQALTVELRMTAEDRDRLMAEMTALRDRSQELSARLSDAEERTALAQRDIAERETRIAALSATAEDAGRELDERRRLAAESETLVDQLNQQIAALRDQLARVGAALEASEAQVGARDIEIANLNARLNQALIRQVEELQRYRSEFFGRLRQVVANRPDITVVGDRFVFQSEVLFPTGSARLEPGGEERLASFARSLLDLAALLPPDIDWILRVDGHTDSRPIRTPEFPSNWELSTARATAVVRFLISQGIPAHRLAAAGFGEFQPLDPTDTEEAFQRNRRIELKLDQR